MSTSSVSSSSLTISVIGGPEAKVTCGPITILLRPAPIRLSYANTSASSSSSSSQRHSYTPSPHAISPSIRWTATTKNPNLATIGFETLASVDDILQCTIHTTDGNSEDYSLEGPLYWRPTPGSKVYLHEQGWTIEFHYSDGGHQLRLLSAVYDAALDPATVRQLLEEQQLAEQKIDNARVRMQAQHSASESESSSSSKDLQILKDAIAER